MKSGWLFLVVGLLIFLVVMMVFFLGLDIVGYSVFDSGSGGFLSPFFHNLFGSSLVFSSSGNLVSGDGLVGLWHFDGDASDSSGSGNDGSLVGNVDCSVAGKFGKGCRFDGEGDYVNFGDVTFLDNIQAFTVSFWMKTSSTEVSSVQVPVSKAGSVETTFNFQMNTFEQLTFSVRNSSDTTVTTGVVSGLANTEWQHIVGVYNGTNILLYADTTLGSQNNLTGPTKNSAYALSIGSRGLTGRYWNGSIDEVAIFNRALSAEEIQELYNAAPSQACTENWNCGNWNSCVNGMQNRTCTDSNNCGTTTSKPAETQFCVTSDCTENWQCGAWGICDGATNNQTRTCNDLNACNITTTKPAESQSCVVGCMEDWTCGSWSNCVNGTQTRTCTDGNNCGTTGNKPAESQSCISGAVCGNGIIESGEQCDSVDLGGVTCGDLGFNSGTLTCSSCSYDTSQCVSLSCSLTSALWSVTNAVEGDIVSLSVTGSNCDGQQINFDINEDDLIGDDAVSIPPQSVLFSNGTAVTTWTAEYQTDWWKNPEFYFDASLASDSNKTINSGLLHVSELTTLPSANNFDGSTTDFSLEPDITNVSNAVLENTANGKIELSGTVDFAGLDLDKYVVIEDKLISVDSASLPELNVPASLTFYNINFASPVAKRDGLACGGYCSNLNYDFVGGILSVDVSGFSNYSVVEGGVVSVSAVQVGDGSVYGESKTVKAYTGVAQSISVFVNDSDGDLLTVSVPATSNNGGKLVLTSGTVNRSGHASFIYASLDSVGQDSFSYTVSDGVNSVQGTITLDVHDVSEASWLPPIGIPMPEFGIEETYRMYDDPAKRNPALTYTQNAEGGYYTHYVDNSVPCNNNNAGGFGNKDAPRCTIPTPLSAGSVVEIHGGPYQYGDPISVVGNGIKEQPVFIRGSSRADRPTFWRKVLIRDSNYVIAENLFFEGSWDPNAQGVGVLVRAISAPSNYVVVRNSELVRSSMALYGESSTSLLQYPVVYNNKIHDTLAPGRCVVGSDCNSPCEGECRTWQSEDEHGGHGIAGGKSAKDIWILDNEVFHTEDGMQFSGERVFIGRNRFYENRENAIDIKGGKDIIFSQNDVFGHRPISTTSGGEGLRIQMRSERVWMMFNRIHDNEIGISAGDNSMDLFAIGNLVYANAHTLKNYDPRDTTGGSLWVGSLGGTAAAIGNTVFAVDVGITLAGGGTILAADNLVSTLNEPDHHIAVTGASTDDSLNNNLLYQPEGNVCLRWDTSRCTDVAGFQGTGSGNIEVDPLLVNVPKMCRLVRFFEQPFSGAVLDETVVDGFARSTLRVAGADFEALGVKPGYRLALQETPDMNCIGNFHDNVCPYLRVSSVATDPLTLIRDVTGTPASNVSFVMNYYPPTQTDLYLSNTIGFAVGDIIEVANDGITRTITAVSSDSLGLKITVSPGIAGGISPNVMVCNWGSNTNLTEDYRLQTNSPAIDQGSLEGIYQKFFDLYGVDIARDFDGTPRPQGAGWDIGAYEYIPTGPVCTDGQTRNCPLQQGVCSGSVETCTGGNWPGCTAVNYGADYEANKEVSCSDKLDNDCDGLTDNLDNNCVVLPSCTDNDNDGYNQTGVGCGSVDCNDNNINVNPRATESCNGVDDNCDLVIDNGGNALCNDGISCTTNVCLGAGGCSYTENHAACQDGAYCNGVEVCSIKDNGCVVGASVECSANDISSVDSCTNSPDDIDTTLDFRNAFKSSCDEGLDSCAIGDSTITHILSLQCGASCLTDDDCVGSEVCNSVGACTGVQCSVHSDCSSGEYCDVSGSCIAKIADGLACDSISRAVISGESQNGVCLSGACNDDYNGDSYCVSEPSSCVHLGDEYSDGKSAPECFSLTNERVCRSGVWVSGADCSDGLFCTIGDRCSAGSCVVGTKRDCADLFSCTDDSCDENLDRCVFVENNGNCAEGLVCSVMNFNSGSDGCGSECIDKDSDGLYERTALCPNGKDVCGNSNFTYFEENPSAFDYYKPDSSEFNISTIDNADALFKYMNFSLELSGKARIMFAEEMRLVRIREDGCFERIRFDNAVKIEYRKVFINSSYHSEFNKRAVVEFYNIDFVDPIVLKDGVVCETCEVVNYSNGIFEVRVPGFSTIEIIEGYVAPPGGTSGGGGGGGGGSRLPLVTNVTEDANGNCLETWGCRDYGECVDGMQVRECAELNGCGTENNKPSLSQECEVVGVEEGEGEVGGVAGPGSQAEGGVGPQSHRRVGVPVGEGGDG